MKKFLSSVIVSLFATNAFAIDPSGSRIDYGYNEISVPLPLLLFVLIIATIACFWAGNFKNEDGKRDAPGMTWLGIIGVIGIIFTLNIILC